MRNRRTRVEEVLFLSSHSSVMTPRLKKARNEKVEERSETAVRFAPPSYTQLCKINRYKSPNENYTANSHGSPGWWFAYPEKGRRGRLSQNLRDDSSIDIWKYQKEKINLKGKRKMKNTHNRRKYGGEVRKRI